MAMKIDLYNNFETHRAQIKQSGQLRAWAKDLGISAKDFEHKIETHPYVADIRVLLDIRRDQHFFNTKDQQVFDKIWNQVYVHEYPLSEYHHRKLAQVITSVEYIKQNMKKTVKMKTKKGCPLAETKLTDFSV
jgi:hypothetical protein